MSKVTAQQKLAKEETRKRDGESHMKMQIQITYPTAPFNARSSVSYNEKKNQTFFFIPSVHFPSKQVP